MSCNSLTIKSGTGSLATISSASCTYLDTTKFNTYSANSWVVGDYIDSPTDGGGYLTYDYHTLQPKWNYPQYQQAINYTYKTGISYSVNNYDMNTTLKKKDDRILLVITLAGFKKNEVKVKYFDPDTTSSEKAYVEYIAESATHPLKSDELESYKASGKYSFSDCKKLNFATAKTSFADGLLTIEIEYDETSKIKELPIA
jgi:HSP20 family molecular chaperone IbpA